jgi:hypothetical protein
MDKQEVLEKIIYYLTKQKPENFYEIKKGKYYINISEIENVSNRQTRTSFSNEDEDYEQTIKDIFNNYKNKQINFQEFKNELSRIMYNESNKLDKILSLQNTIPLKRKQIEEKIKYNILLLEDQLKLIAMNLNDINIDFYFSNYMKFVHKIHNGKFISFETESCLSTIDSYTDFMCRESVLENIVKEHYLNSSKILDIKHEKKKNEFYSELKNLFMSFTKEELYIPIEKLWQIKLDLNILYYIPVKEAKPISFYFITDKLRVNYKMKIDPYLYNTVNNFQQLYIEEASQELRQFYYDVFGTNDYRKDFLGVLKNKGGWQTARNLFINLCIVNNTYIFGELLRNWTKEKKFYEDATYDKNYPSYVKNDIISQKIKSGIETQKEQEDFIIQCNIFDRKDDLDSEFVDKIPEVVAILFDNYKLYKNNEEKNDEE